MPVFGRPHKIAIRGALSPPPDRDITGGLPCTASSPPSCSRSPAIKCLPRPFGWLTAAGEVNDLTLTTWGRPCSILRCMVASSRPRRVGIDVVPERVRQALAEAGLSFGELAKGAGVTRQTMHNVATGKARPSAPVLEHIIRMTGKDLDFFLPRTGR